MADLCNFATLNDHQLQAINGGLELEKIANGMGAIASAATIATTAGGITVTQMTVGACLSCGPIGWAIVGTLVIGSFIGGYLIGDGLR